MMHSICHRQTSASWQLQTCWIGVQPFIHLDSSGGSCRLLEMLIVEISDVSQSTKKLNIHIFFHILQFSYAALMKTSKGENKKMCIFNFGVNHFPNTPSAHVFFLVSGGRWGASGCLSSRGTILSNSSTELIIPETDRKWMWRQETTCLRLHMDIIYHIIHVKTVY